MDSPWKARAAFWLSNPQTARIAVQTLSVDLNRPHFRSQIGLASNKNVVSCNIIAQDQKALFSGVHDCVQSIAFIQKTIAKKES